MLGGVSDFSCKYTHGTSTVGGGGKATVRTTVRTDRSSCVISMDTPCKPTTWHLTNNQEYGIETHHVNLAVEIKASKKKMTKFCRISLPFVTFFILHKLLVIGIKTE